MGIFNPDQGEIDGVKSYYEKEGKARLQFNKKAAILTRLLRAEKYWLLFIYFD